MAEFLQKLNAGKAVSAAGMTLSEIVETIYIPYTQEKRASTRIKDSPDTLASCLRRFLAHTISHELGIGAGNTLQGGSAAFRKPFTDAVGKWLIPDSWVCRKNSSTST